MDRFWSKVDKSGNCWIWTSCTRGKTGYGAFKYKRKMIDAHRMAYILTKGYIMDGFFVCHTCDNRMCVNPSHLIPGTYLDNIKDMTDRGRKAAYIKHPSLSSYINRKCRCNDCVNIYRHYRTSQSRHMREYRRTKNTSNLGLT